MYGAVNVRCCECTVLWKIFWPKRGRKQGNGEDCIIRSFMICTPHPIHVIQVIKSGIILMDEHVAILG